MSEQIVALAGVRRVRTPEGAAFYNLPIGSPILPGMELAINSRAKSRGLTPPVGALEGGLVPNPKTTLPIGKFDSKAGLTTLSGPNKFKVGGVAYSAPKGSKVLLRNGGKNAFVITKEGKIHSFVSHGEVDTSDEVNTKLKALLQKEGLWPENVKESDVLPAGEGNLPDATSTDESKIPEKASPHAFKVLSEEKPSQSKAPKDQGTEKTQKESKNTEGDSGTDSAGDAEASGKSETSEFSLDKPETFSKPTDEVQVSPDKTHALVKSKNGELSYFDKEGKVEFEPEVAETIQNSIAKAFKPSDKPVIQEVAPKEPMQEYVDNNGKTKKLPTSGLKNWQPPEGDSPLDKEYKQVVAKSQNSAQVTTDTKAPVKKPVPSTTSKTEEKSPLDMKPKAGDKIENASQIAQLTKGSEVTFTNGFGKSVDLVVSPTKDLVHPQSGKKYTPAQVQKTISKGGLQVKSVASLPASLNPKAQSRLWTKGELVSHKDIQEAFDALHAFKGTQLKYALKNMPNNPVLKDIEHIKDIAKDKYSAFSMKHAMINYLDDALKGESLIERSFDPDAPFNKQKIKIGAGIFKTNKQGSNKGTFTAGDVLSAIKILEDYEGKQYKAQLKNAGNPLGDLDPTKIIGLYKDKVEGKKVFTTLLKAKVKKLKESVDKPQLKNEKAIDEIPIGGVVKDKKDNKGLLTKQTEEQFADSEGKLIPKKEVVKDAKEGEVTKEADPVDVVASSVPEAVTSKFVTPVDVDNFDKDSVSDAKPLTHIQTTDGKTDYVKQNDGTWAEFEDLGDLFGDSHSQEDNIGDLQPKEETPKYVFGGDSGVPSYEVGGSSGMPSNTKGSVDFDQPAIPAWKKNLGPSHVPDSEIAKKIDSGEAQLVEKEGPKDSHVIAPGTYSTPGGVATMKVNADGTGKFSDSKGNSKDLTPESVQKNFVAGMDELKDGETPGVPNTPAKQSAKKTSEDLVDGNYFLGNPDNPLTSIISITGGKANAYDSVIPDKPLSGHEVAEAAPDGTVIDSVGANLSYEKINGYWQAYVNGKPVSTPGKTLVGYFTIKTLGPSKTSMHPAKELLEKSFQEGSLTDSTFTSVVPKGYTGSVIVGGFHTSVPDLQKLKKNPDFLSNYLENVNAEDLPGKLVNIGLNKSFSQGNGNITGKNYLDNVEKILSSVITKDTGDSTLFTHDAFGNAQYPTKDIPASLLLNGNMDSFIEAATKNFGKLDNGESVLNVKGIQNADDIGKEIWAKAFISGNFKKAYDMEMDFNANKPWPNHDQHPGYPANDLTHKVPWSTGVPGETPVSKKVGDGNWPAANDPWTTAEIDNYLISAHMQNPTMLDAKQRKQWVVAHANGDSDTVTRLSLKAAQYQNFGYHAVSSPPAWTAPAQLLKMKSGQKTTAGIFNSDGTVKLEATKIVSQEKLDAWFKKNPTSIAAIQYQKFLSTNPDITETDIYGNPSPFAEFRQYLKNVAPFEKNNVKVFSKSADQPVKATNPIFTYNDQDNNLYWFKPKDPGNKGTYQTDVEFAGNKLSKLFGNNSVEVSIETIDGKRGLMQADAKAVTELSTVDLSKLTTDQYTALLKEHVLDLYLNNDDSHDRNFKVGEDGTIIGIDKGRALEGFGKWDPRDPNMGGNAIGGTVYNKLAKEIKAGKVDKSALDQAISQALRHAESIKARSKGEAAQKILNDALASRKYFDDLSYSIGGNPVPKSKEGLLQAIQDRADNLPDIIKDIYQKLYDDLGWGSVPEPVKVQHFGEGKGQLRNSVTSTAFHEEVKNAGAFGTATFTGSSNIVGGHYLMWNEHTNDGQEFLAGYAQVTPKTNRVLTDKLSAAASVDTTPKTGFQGSDWTTFKSKYLTGKLDGVEYKTLSTLKASLVMNSLQGKADVNKKAAHSVKSWMDKVSKEIDTVEIHLSDNLSVTTPLGNTIIPADKEQYYEYLKSKLKNLSDLHNLANGKKASFNLSEWSPWTSSDSLSGKLGLPPGVTVEKVSGGPLIQSTYKNGKKILDLNSGKPVVGDTTGSHFKITLPTGERIFFRDSKKTGTALGQEGTIQFLSKDGDSVDAQSASMSRIQSVLDKLGIGAGDGTDVSAKNTYWREMYGIIRNQNHFNGATDKSKKFAAMESKLEKKLKSLGIFNKQEELDELSEKLGADGELQFWEDLWSTDPEFAQKIPELYETGGYLPKFESFDYKDPSKRQGLPYWERFDITDDEIRAMNVQLGATTGTGMSPVDYHKPVDNTNPSFVLDSAGMLSTEERLRVMNLFAPGDGFESQEIDQANGGSFNVYTRMFEASAKAHYSVFFDPTKILKRTRTHGFSFDAYGKKDLRKDNSPSDPLAMYNYMKEKIGTDTKNMMAWRRNEILPPNSLSLVTGAVAGLVFSNETSRQAMIKKLKDQGITELAGVPIEQRFIVKGISNLNAFKQNVLGLKL